MRKPDDWDGRVHYDSGMDTVIEIAAWDMISTAERGLVVILPPIPRPRCILVAHDAIYIGTSAATVRLLRSEHLSGVVATARHVIVAESDDMIRRETLVVMRITHMDLSKEGSRHEHEDGRVAA